MEFLKREYGHGGHSHALSGSTGSYMDHSSKGMTLEKQDCVPIELSWKKVAARFDDLIRLGRYFSPEALEKYEADHSAPEEVSEELPEEIPEQPQETSERNTASVTDNAAKQMYLADQEKTVTVDLILYAEEETTNGLQTISVDSDLLELRSVSCDGLSSYRTAGDRTVLGFVTAGVVMEGEPLASLTFRVKDGGMEAEVLIRELERNNCHVEIETARSLQGHIWSSWSLTEAASCGEDGTEMRVCADCQKTEFRSVPATGEHDW